MVLLKGLVQGSFAQMLVLETLLEHGQLVFLLVALFFDDNFIPHLLKVIPKQFSNTCWSKSNVVSINALEASRPSDVESEIAESLLSSASLLPHATPPGSGASLPHASPTGSNQSTLQLSYVRQN